MDASTPYAIRITTCARHQLNALPVAERLLVERHLMQVGLFSAQYRTSPGERFLRRGEPTTLLELRVWPFLILYEPAHAERAVTVLHVLRLPEAPAAAPSERVGA